jgi:thiol-disulfide isomerase/thioredoxin
MLIKILLIQICVLFMTFLHAQSIALYTIIDGVIPIAAVGEHEVSVRVSNRLSILEPDRTFTQKTRAGNFKFRFALKDTETIRISIDSLEIRGFEPAGTSGMLVFIDPGDSIFINIPSVVSRFYEDIKITGRGANKYDFMTRFSREIASTLDSLKNVSVMSKLIGMKRKVTSIFDSSNEPISRESLATMRAITVSFYHYSLMLHASTYDFSMPGKIDEYLKYESYFPLDELVLGSDGDIVMASVFFSYAKLKYLFTRNAGKWNSDLTDFEYFSAIERAFDSKSYRNRLLASHIFYCIRRSGLTEDNLSLLARFYEVVPVTDSHRKSLAELVKRLEDSQMNGIDLSIYRFVDLRGQTVSLAEFSGKLILLDFYFFGCLYCKDIAPEMEKVEKEFDGRNDLVFLSVSIDATKEQFKKGVGVYSSRTSQALFTGGVGGSHNIIRDFGINGYPTLMLIGKNCQLIDNHAPAPSSGKRRAELIALIKRSL